MWSCTYVGQLGASCSKINISMGNSCHVKEFYLSLSKEASKSAHCGCLFHVLQCLEGGHVTLHMYELIELFVM